MRDRLCAFLLKHRDLFPQQSRLEAVVGFDPAFAIENKCRPIVDPVGGQCGIAGLWGFPLRANAVQLAAIRRE
jgi:hypothetical protein